MWVCISRSDAAASTGILCCLQLWYHSFQPTQQFWHNNFIVLILEERMLGGYSIFGFQLSALLSWRSPTCNSDIWNLGETTLRPLQFTNWNTSWSGTKTAPSHLSPGPVAKIFSYLTLSTPYSLLTLLYCSVAIMMFPPPNLKRWQGICLLIMITS